MDLLWALLMVDQRDDDKLAFVVTNIAWALWNDRNVVRHKGTRKGSVVIFQGAINYLNEYHDANPVDVVPV